MLKYFLIGLVILSLVALVGCAIKPAVLGEHRTFKIKSDIHSLNVEINAAEFTVEQGTEFLVESNLKNLIVAEENGVLTIIDKTKVSNNYIGATLKLCIPEGVTFDKAQIKTGAARLTADLISANT